MNHVAYLDAKSKEMEKLLTDQKTMIIRGAAGRKIPYGQVKKDDTLYFINNNAEGMIKAIADVFNVINSEKMDKETSIKFIKNHQNKLQLTEKQFQRWAGKRYIVLIEIKNMKEITPFQFNRDEYKSKMDDWLIFEKIDEIRK
jgi:dihydroxyacetone kinase-like predicted kinase